MVKDYQFNDIKIYLKKETSVGQKILDACENLLDSTIIRITPFSGNGF